MCFSSSSAAQSSRHQAVSLPLSQAEDFISQRHEVNPALAFSLLQDIQTVIMAWKEELQHVVKAMHTLHSQGPMVNGWLESSLDMATEPLESASLGQTLLRHGDTEALIRYVESLEENSAQGSAQGNVSPIAPADVAEMVNPAARYSLCTLDGNGNVRSQPCPLEQIASVSTAIARYHQFKQLIQQRQAIEAKLQNTVNHLTDVRAGLQ
ncbi:MAG: hypothetical protein HC800_13870 [Phormidesmis sp. RL_2_1]|nr:hypothetical protein [Phormidesmis sp. RL_2_1]